VFLRLPPAPGVIRLHALIQPSGRWGTSTHGAKGLLPFFYTLAIAGIILPILALFWPFLALSCTTPAHTYDHRPHAAPATTQTYITSRPMVRALHVYGNTSSTAQRRQHGLHGMLSPCICAITAFGTQARKPSQCGQCAAPACGPRPGPRWGTSISPQCRQRLANSSGCTTVPWRGARRACPPSAIVSEGMAFILAPQLAQCAMYVPFAAVVRWGRVTSSHCLQGMTGRWGIITSPFPASVGAGLLWPHERSASKAGANSADIAPHPHHAICPHAHMRHKVSRASFPHWRLVPRGGVQGRDRRRRHSRHETWRPDNGNK